VGGALAGSLLTAVLLARPAAPGVAVREGGKSQPAPRAAESATDVVKPSNAVAGSTAPREETSEIAARWSSAEFLVANRIMNLGRLAPAAGTLQAGSYVRLSSAHGPWPTSAGMATRYADRAPAGGTGDSRPAPASEDDGSSRPAPITQDELLRELLGAGAISTL
jgi:hypothetical protein